MALAAYRNLMQAARIAFRGDGPVLAAAQVQIRQKFRQNSTLDSSGSAAQDAIRQADDVARLLRENVVQGKRAEADGLTYKLRIHEHTEKGDNDTVNAGEPGVAGSGCGCK